MADSINRLYQAVLSCRHDDPSTSRTARLLRAGRSKMAKKLAEEAVEVVIDAMHGDRFAVTKESADLLYNLVVLWVAAGIRPEDVWKEMDRRERLLGIAEKVPKKVLDDSSRRKIIALESRRVRKRALSRRSSAARSDETSDTLSKNCRGNRRVFASAKTRASHLSRGRVRTLTRERNYLMAYRTMIVLAATAAIGVASFSSTAFAFRGGGGFHGGVGRGGVGVHGGIYRGGVGHGAYARRGWGPDGASALRLAQRHSVRPPSAQPPLRTITTAQLADITPIRPATDDATALQARGWA